MPTYNKYGADGPISFISDSIENAIIDINTMLPARVKEYDADSGRAIIEPLINILLNSYDSKGAYNSISIPPLSDIPVMFFGNKSAYSTLKIEAGDSGILLFSQRSLDEWKAQLKGTAQKYSPRSIRKFDINDAVFFPAFLAGGGSAGTFGGMTTANKSDVLIKDGEVEIGSKSAKAQLKGPGQDIPQALKNLHDRVGKIEDSATKTASIGVLGVPSTALPIVLINAISSKILGKIGQVFIKRAFIQAENDLLSKLGQKALSIAANGVINRKPQEPPVTEENAEVGIQIAIEHNSVTDSNSFVRNEAGNSNGWVLKGINNLPGVPDNTFNNDGAGNADFSLFENKLPSWSKVTAFYLQWINSETENYLTVGFAPDVISGINAVNRIVISSEDVDEFNENNDINLFDTSIATISRDYVDNPQYIVGSFIIPELTTLENIPNPFNRESTRKTIPIKGLYLRNEINNNIEAVYNRTTSFFSSAKQFPVFRVYFLDKEGKMISLNTEDFQ